MEIVTHYFVMPIYIIIIALNSYKNFVPLRYCENKCSGRHTMVLGGGICETLTHF